MSADPLVQIALAPLGLVTDPAERLWWPALLGALVIAVGWDWIATRRRPSPRRAAAALAHPSSVLDAKFVFVRASLRVLLLAGVLAGATWLAVKVVTGLWATVGAPPAPPGGGWMVGMYSVALFLASDASRYCVHRVFHTIPSLWRFHKVHHSAQVLTPLTLYRIHPFEQIAQSGRSLFVLGIVGGAFAWVSHGTAGPMELFGVPAAVLSLNVLGANLRHTHVRVAYPAVIEHLLISPAQHQLHHGDGVENRSNLGAFLAVWDWLGGTLLCSRTGTEVRFGLSADELNHDPTRLVSALLDPLRRH